jgi:predicted lipoprotein with Yx(FWY)xxD motif
MTRHALLLLIAATFAFNAQPAAASWPAQGAAVCTASGAQDTPALQPDGLGGVFVAWSDSRAGASASGIYMQHLAADGTALWAANGKALSTSPQGQVGPQLASDDSGGVIVVWEDRRADAGDIYAQRVDANGNIRWTAGGVPMVTATNEQSAPVVVASPSGGAIIAWVDTRSSTSCTIGYEDIFAQRVNAGGATQWAANGVPVCTMADDQDGLRAVPDGSNGAMLSWSDKRQQVPDVYAQDLTTGGAKNWGASDALVIRAADAQDSLDIVADPGGGAFFVWLDYRALTASVYAQHLDAGGLSGWASGGVQVFASSNPGHPPKVIAGGDGVIVAARIGGQVAVQQLDGSGNRIWAGPGVSVSRPGGMQQSVGLVSDDALGAIVGWVEFPGGSGDVYAQHVDLSGTPLWTPFGVAICTAIGTQDQMQMAEDGSGGAILVWRDKRSGESDIYAQRVSADGTVGMSPTDVPPQHPQQFSLQPIYPNPSRREARLEFTLPEEREVEVEVFDVAGRSVKHVFHGTLVAGVHDLTWDGNDDAGRRVASGAYLVRFTAGSTRKTAALRMVR